MKTIIIDGVEYNLTPKVSFHEGDWVVFNNKHQSIYQVEKIEDGYYILRHTHGGTFRVCVLHDESLRLWTIQDAKDGDVLVAKGEYFKEYIFIYSKMTDDDVISTHCGYDVIRNASDKTMSRFGRVEDFHSVCPATKEQRDQLEKAMADAGYTFDFEKKELKKMEQKPAWSEEDENEVAILEAYIRSNDWSESHVNRALGIVDELVKKLKSTQR